MRQVSDWHLVKFAWSLYGYFSLDEIECMTQAFKKGLSAVESKRVANGEETGPQEQGYSNQEVIAMLLDLYIGRHTCSMFARF